MHSTGQHVIVKKWADSPQSLSGRLSYCNRYGTAYAGLAPSLALMLQRCGQNATAADKRVHRFDRVCQFALWLEMITNWPDQLHDDISQRGVHHEQ